MREPDKILRDAADLFQERDAIYGSTYKDIGKVLLAIFPNGVELTIEQDFARFATMVMCITKIVRYASCFPDGGHLDSTRDLQVYAAFLEMHTRGSE